MRSFLTEMGQIKAKNSKFDLIGYNLLRKNNSGMRRSYLTWAVRVG